MRLLIVLAVMYVVLKVIDKLIDVFSKPAPSSKSGSILDDIDRPVKRYYEDGIFTLEELSQMDPRDYEWWCSDLLKDLGYTNVSVTPEKLDGGKDIICTHRGEIVYVECKRYQHKETAMYMADRSVVQKLVGAMVGDKVKKGMVITTGIVTEGAIEYVNTLPSDIAIELIDGYKLMELYKGVQTKRPQPQPQGV